MFLLSYVNINDILSTSNTGKYRYLQQGMYVECSADVEVCSWSKPFSDYKKLHIPRLP